MDRGVGQPVEDRARRWRGLRAGEESGKEPSLIREGEAERTPQHRLARYLQGARCRERDGGRRSIASWDHGGVSGPGNIAAT
jgi:hypothetical protein